jgi:hypothetical protein
LRHHIDGDELELGGHSAIEAPSYIRWRGSHAAFERMSARVARRAFNEHGGAIKAFADLTRLAQTTGDRQVVPVAVEGMARAFRRLDEPIPAIRLFAAAEAAREHLSSAGAVSEAASRDRVIARLKASVGEDAFVAAWERRRNLGFSAAIGLGFDEADTIGRSGRVAGASQ